MDLTLTPSLLTLFCLYLCKVDEPTSKQQRDYNHGTGHGVGYFLNVHQGPQIISYFKPVNGQNVMKAGMLTSDEPGLCRPGKWGIRIENLLVTRKVKKLRDRKSVV